MVELDSAELFRLLPLAELAFAHAAAQIRTYPTGAEIFREGDPGDGLFVLLDGAVEIAGQVASGRRLVLSTIQPGQIFGEMAVIEQLPRSACATAVRPTTVAFLGRAEMQIMLQRSPALASALLQHISHRLREFNHHYLTDMVQTERLAAVGRFARSIIHDLKNPLNIIGLTTELMQRPNQTAAQLATATNRITKQLARLNDLIADMLHFTQTGNTLTLHPVAFAEYLTGVVAELQPELELTGVTLELAGPPPALTLPVDGKSLRRVFHNLVHNAAEAMGEGGRITVSFQTTPQELIVELADTGPGLPQELANRLFEPFATHGKSHGTGLGLSICKKIITDHGGEISARNAPGGGAVFRFTLPLVTPNQAAPQRAG